LKPKLREVLQEPESDFHKQMLKECLDLLKSSQDVMSGYYAEWDFHQQIYKGERTRDKADHKAAERKEPEKMVVPMSFAQIQTFIAFCFHLFNQRPNFFELAGSGMEDAKAARIAEAVLARDLTYNKFLVILYQFLLNIGRYGLGVIKHSWFIDQKPEYVKKQAPPQQAMFSQVELPGQMQMVLENVVKFMGNKLVGISPYRFFPDPRLPITQFQEGDFCAAETDVTMMWCRKMQKSGMLSGVEHIKNFGSTDFERRTEKQMRSKVSFDATTGKQTGGIVLTEVQRLIIPKEYKMPGGEALGEEDYPIMYVVCIGNENRVVKCEPMNYPHDRFTYSAAQLSPDEQESCNVGVAGLINELQSTITWLFNSRVTSVRKTVNNQIVVDPEGVEMQDIAERKSVIRLKKGAARSGVDRWIKSLDIKDVTAGHIEDAQTLAQLMQVVTGINENALGQYSKGRRSAAQTEAVNSGAASRLKMYATLIWVQALQPLGEDMLANLRYGLDAKQLVRVMGQQLLMPQSPYAAGPVDAQSFLSVDKSDLCGNYDFVMLDGTAPTEKNYLASQLQEVLAALLSNPMAAAILGLDAKNIMTEIATLNGIRNPERFFLQPLQQQQLMMAAAQGGQPQLGAPGASAAATTQAAGQPQNGLDFSQLIGGQALPQLSFA
jgi:hypothetical protein